MVRILCLAIVLLSSAPVQAAGYGRDVMEIRVKDHSISLFPRNFYTIEFFNTPYISESHFTMRLASYGEVSGCAGMSDGAVEARRVNDSIKLKVTDSEIELDDVPRYSNYDCKIKRNKSFFDISLDRDYMIRQNIKKIALTSEKYGEFLTADVTIDRHKITMSPHKAHMVTFWFFPSDSIALHAPGAQQDRDIRDIIRSYGVAHGLVPMEKILDGFELPHAGDYVLFTDPGRRMTERLEGAGSPVNTGHITPVRTVYTATGPREEFYSLAIYAARPPQQNRQEY